ncbi:probable U3 small nucleolar ribonucleoprotein protein MPP10 at C-terminar half [Coccomyxa sp. Obi]|nr:probable U3 small nucleolar ribonucleoprotein protein MPP10 at C-terminar half [Coccomyxa sp. Obi]
MAGPKGAAVRRSTRKAAYRDGNIQGGDVMNINDDVHGASGEENVETLAAQPSLRRSRRAAAKPADEDVPSAEAICSPAEEAAAEQVDVENGADTDGSAGSDTDDDDDDDDGDDAELDVFEEGTREAVDSFEAAVAEPAAFLQPSAEISHLARRAAKALYDLAAAEAAAASTGKGATGAAGPQLYVEGFDAEQIWLQLEMQSEGALKRARRLFKKAGEVPHLVLPEMEEALDELLGNKQESEESSSESDEDEEGDTDGDAPDNMDEADESEGGQEDMEEDEEGEDLDILNKRKTKGDLFFQMGDMDRFAEDAEQAAMRSDNDEDEEETDDEEEDEDQLPAGDAEADSDDGALDALLQDARKMSGSRAEKRTRFREDDGDHDDEDPGAAAKYSDFFDDPDERPGDEVNDADDIDADHGEDPDGNFDLDDDEDDEDGRLGEPSVPEDRHDTGAGAGPLSTHERRMARMAERVRALEAENMGDKDWFMRGETSAGARPLNSALEVDLDFERAVRPPPQPTEEVTASLEDLIRARIADHNFDDVPRVAPPAPEKKTKTIDLDDKKSGKGLGEIYEEEYVRAAAGGAATQDRDEKVRAEARSLVKALFAKLDALSHFHFAPKPVIEDLSVRADVPALAMEEVAPQVVSEAAMRLPEEVFRAEAKGAPRAEEELSREERRRRRAKKKRAHKSRSTQQAEETAGRPVTQGGAAAAPGRKSAAAEEAAAAAAKAQKKRARRGADSREAGADAGRAKRVKFGSSAVFGQLQDQREAAAAGADKPGKKAAAHTSTSKALKL